MDILVVWIIVSILVGVAASHRGRDGVGWFGVSVLVSPLVAPLLLLVLPNLNDHRRKVTELRSSRICPHCAERINLDASICRWCRQNVPPATDQDRRDAARNGRSNEGFAFGGVLLLVAAACALFSWLSEPVRQKTISETETGVPSVATDVKKAQERPPGVPFSITP
jgi:hypothetical protein